MPEMETWRNVTKGTTFIRRYDDFGRPRDEIVPANGVIRITPEDRRLQSDNASAPGYDIFHNGTMQPVRLLEGHEDTAELLENPNARTETEINEMFQLHWKKFETALQEISNSTLLQRILEVAEERDGTTIKQLNTIKQRLMEADPHYVVEGIPRPPIGKFEGATPL